MPPDIDHLVPIMISPGGTCSVCTLCYFLRKEVWETSILNILQKQGLRSH